MKEQYEFCKKFGFGEQKKQARLDLLGFNDSDHRLAEIFRDKVIRPNENGIIDQFYERLLEYPGYQEILNRYNDLDDLKSTQRGYLSSLGMDFSTLEYFEERLRIGYVHLKVGLEPDLYQCAYYILQQIIIDIMKENVSDLKQRDELTAFLLKVTTLDISLAIETYHLSQIHKLNSLLEYMHSQTVILQRRAETDELTSVLRREYLLEMLQRVVLGASQDESNLCVIMADLDHFKEINDQYGHLAGDAVLRGVASRMQSALRGFDLIGRYGGEEFLFILQNTPLPIAKEVAERVRTRINTTEIHVDEKSIPVSISQGIAVLQKGEDMDSLINRADQAMYAAKHAGRDCVRV
jgi:diguanylate cyclase (GGDEF)-like protein